MARGRWTLELQSLNGRTCLTHRRHSGPLLVQRAFYPNETRRCSDRRPPCTLGRRRSRAHRQPPPRTLPSSISCIPPAASPAAMILALSVDVGPGAHACSRPRRPASSIAAGAGGHGALDADARVTGGVLEWLPQENIFYPDAAVELRDASCACPAAPASSAGRSAAWDCRRIGQTLQSGEMRQCVRALARMRGRCCSSVSPSGPSSLCRALGPGRPRRPRNLARLSSRQRATSSCAREATRAMHCAGLTLACTLVDGVLVCRACGARTDRLRAGLLRLVERAAACAPGPRGRAAAIWAT